MAPEWKGGATGVAQVDKLTPGDAPADTAVVYYITVTNRLGESHKVSSGEPADTSGSAVCSAIATALAAAKAAGEDPWDELTADTTTSTAYVTITADSAGEPFWLSAVTTNETATMTSASVTAVGGSNIFADADNWDTNTAPAAGDIPVVPADATISIYGETYGTDKGLNGLIVEPGCSINIGSHAKPLDLAFDTAAGVTLGLDGSGEAYLNIRSEKSGSNTSAVINVTGAGAGSGADTYGMNLTSDTADVIAEVNVSAEANERVSLAARQGDSAAFSTVRVQAGDVSIGSAADTGAIAATVSGGTVYNKNNVGVLSQTGGTVYHEGTGTMTSANVDAGTLYYKSSGQLDSGTIGGTIDFSKDPRTHTIDSTKGFTLRPGATLKDPHGTLGDSAGGTTNKIALAGGAGVGDVTVELGVGKTLTVT